MKKKISIITLLSGFALLIVGALILSSCEGPEGPAGAAGAAGQDGIDGTNGIDGIDASTTCTECHDDNQMIVTKTKQYNNSAHAMGTTSGYTNRSYGPTYNCAGCHTSQGYLDNLMGESNIPYANITQPNCYTCHKIHETYTAEDWALQQSDVVTPMTGSEGVDLGSGNQCVSCHQFTSYYLDKSELFANFDDGGSTSIDITAGELRAGVHHAPQYNILTGMDLFEFSGTTEYPTNNHVLDQAADGCVTCHMNDGFGDLTGHSMSMTYSFHGPQYNWPASCLECHVEDGANDLSDKIEAVETENEALMVQVYDLLVAAGIMYPADGSNAYLMMPGTFTTDLTAALVNYNAIREDKSAGFHNPRYTAAILANTIEALTP